VHDMTAWPLPHCLDKLTRVCSHAIACRFDTFHVYVCAAFLLKFAPQLKSMKFTELVTFIQRMPTSAWAVKDVEELLAQAYVYKTLFEASPSHLSS